MDAGPSYLLCPLVLVANPTWDVREKEALSYHSPLQRVFLPHSFYSLLNDCQGNPKPY